jgi:ankyrin repeat protein
MEVKNLVELIREGNTSESISYLAKSGRTTDVGEWGESPLMAAIQEDDFEVVKAILSLAPDIEHENEDGWSAIESAAIVGNAEIFSMILKAGGNVNRKLNDPLQKGMTPLHWAANRGHCSIVQMCLDQGAKIDVKDGNGITPLMIQKSIEMTELLLEAGASRTVKNKQRRNSYQEHIYQAKAFGGDDPIKERQQIINLLKPARWFGFF